MPQSCDNHKLQEKKILYPIKKTPKNLWFFLVVSQKGASSHNALFKAWVRDVQLLVRVFSYISSFEESVSKAALFLVSPCLPLQGQGLSVKPVFRAGRWTHFQNWHALMYTYSWPPDNCACMKYHPEKPIFIQKQGAHQASTFTHSGAWIWWVGCEN